MAVIGRVARSPIVLSPARSRPWVAPGSSSRAATGSRRMAKASSLAGWRWGCCAMRWSVWPSG
jgi:hypothetical protein